MSPRLIPEFDVLALDASLEFYEGEIGFSIIYDRLEERFVYLDLEGVHLMLEETSGAGRRFHAEPLERPLGRGMNLQIQVSNVNGSTMTRSRVGAHSILQCFNPDIKRTSLVVLSGRS